MKLLPDERTHRIFETVLASLPVPMPVYLVGGAVRDSLLGLPVNDLDFVVPSNSLQLARVVGRKLGAVGFTLDDERQTARLILEQGKPSELILDFVSFTGSSLSEDLSNRDFTINTLAVALDQPDKLIDLLGGERDLREGRLRAASVHSMELDPLRLLRGVRLSLAYRLNIEPETFGLMRNSVSSLVNVSGERIRDEIFKILEHEDLELAFQQFDALELTEQVFPELSAVKQIPAYPPHVHDLWKHTLQVARYLAVIRDYIQLGKLPDANQFLREACTMLSQYAESLRETWSVPLQGGRSRWSLLLLAALYHDSGKPAAQTTDAAGRIRFIGHERISADLIANRAQALMLGRGEVDYLRQLTANHMRLHFFSKEGTQLSDRACYRYFRDLRETGVDAVLLSLADMLAAYEDTLEPAKWQRELGAALTLLDAWFSRREQVVEPRMLLDGDDLQHEFGLEPGAIIGELLAQLREAQASGEVYNRAGAVLFVREILHNKNVHARYQ